MTRFDGFGSDNHAGVHPNILSALHAANTGYAVAYGDDPYTERAIKKLKKILGQKADIFFVYNGTAANILGLKNVTQSFQSVLCAETAHLNVHECCGPEHFIGCKLTIVPTPDGKLTVDLLKPYLVEHDDVHMAQPHVVSITQATEQGTVYTSNEIKTLADFIHSKGMILHMDGARLSNAAAFLQTSLAEISGDAGVDVLSFGGTKNGLMFGEAVIFFQKNFAQNFGYIRKQGMQLASKMRFIAVQFDALMTDNLWLHNATHANKMAQLLGEKLAEIPSVKITQKIQANMVFAVLPKKIITVLQKKYFFHMFNSRTSEIRFVCSFQTKEDDVMRLVQTVHALIKKGNCSTL
ncbi:MAG: low specificity L-threonine aldolase [Candidatus Thermoplasmatota archaeon]